MRPSETDRVLRKIGGRNVFGTNPGNVERVFDSSFFCLRAYFSYRTTRFWSVSLVALSGDANDIARTDKLALELFPKNQTLARWMKLARERIQFQGLPSRICWLGYGERAEFGIAINELVKRGEIKAPIVIGRDHLDAGSVASPNRETEGMLDGSDAIADWPLLNALINTAAGASWVSIHNGGGVESVSHSMLEWLSSRRD